MERFNELLERHPKLVGLIFGIAQRAVRPFGSRVEADDLFQEVSLTFGRKYEAGEFEEAVAAYCASEGENCRGEALGQLLRVIAHGKAIDLYRKVARQPASTDTADAEPDLSDNPEQAVIGTAAAREQIDGLEAFLRGSALRVYSYCVQHELNVFDCPVDSLCRDLGVTRQVVYNARKQVRDALTEYAAYEQNNEYFHDQCLRLERMTERDGCDYGRAFAAGEAFIKRLPDYDVAWGHIHACLSIQHSAALGTGSRSAYDACLRFDTHHYEEALKEARRRQQPEQEAWAHCCLGTHYLWGGWWTGDARHGEQAVREFLIGVEGVYRAGQEDLVQRDLLRWVDEWLVEPGPYVPTRAQVMVNRLELLFRKLSYANGLEWVKAARNRR